jgi:hypothetical protein
MKKIIIMLSIAISISLSALNWKVDFTVTGVIDDMDDVIVDSTVVEETVVSDTIFQDTVYVVTTNRYITNKYTGSISGIDNIRTEVYDAANLIFIDPNVSISDVEYLNDEKIFMAFKISGYVVWGTDIDGLSEQIFTYFSSMMADVKVNFTANISNN